MTLYGKNEENQGEILKIYPTLSIYFKMLILFYVNFSSMGKKYKMEKKKEKTGEPAEHLL